MWSRQFLKIFHCPNISQKRKKRKQSIIIERIMVQKNLKPCFDSIHVDCHKNQTAAAIVTSFFLNDPSNKSYRSPSFLQE